MITMTDKIKAMFGSVRFWYAVVLACAYFVEQMGWCPDAVAIAVKIFALLGISVRTIDKFSK